MARLEPLSQTIINCAKAGIPLRAIMPNGVILEPNLTDIQVFGSIDNYDQTNVENIAEKFRGLKRGTKRP